MTLLEQLKISNFRGFDNLEIDGLSKINLFVGKNNSGKTSILEAVFLLMGMSNPTLPNNINVFRGLAPNLLKNLSTVKQLKYLFHNLLLENKPDFYGKFNDTSERWLKLQAKVQQSDLLPDLSSLVTQNITGLELKFSYKQKHSSKKDYTSTLNYSNVNNLVPQTTIPVNYRELINAIFLSDKNEAGLLERLSEIVKQKGGDMILNTLRETFDNNIIGLFPLEDGIYFNLKDVSEFLPSNVMGDGIRRFLNIVTAVSEKKNSVVCIDELENGLHYTTYKQLWKNLIIFSEQNNIQLFITTHNIETLECLKSVLDEEKFKSMQDFAKVFTVAKTKNAGYQTYRYSFEGFKNAIEHETEIRS